MNICSVLFERTMDQLDKPRFNQYLLVAELGRGTTGIVYKAQHRRFPRLVALKTILLVTGVDMKVRVARLLREAQILASLTLDPNIPSVYELGEWKGHSYYCREFIDGQTLEQAVKSSAINRREAMHIVTTVTRTLARVHDRGIVHRNLSPDNVLVTSEGTVKLIGFGLVAAIDTDKSPSQISEDIQLIGKMLAWLCSQTQGLYSDMLEVIVRRCTLEISHGGYNGALFLADDLERCFLSLP